MRLLLAGLVLVMGATGALAQQSRVPPVESYKQMVEAIKPNGWVAFREYNGIQYIYFTALITFGCGLNSISYSINSDALDQDFPLAGCVPANPFALPPDAPADATLLTMAPGTAKTIALQVEFTDGTKSDVMVYEPCEGVGDQTCAFPVEN